MMTMTQAIATGDRLQSVQRMRKHALRILALLALTPLLFVDS
jgi:hypothetical protein